MHFPADNCCVAEVFFTSSTEGAASKPKEAALQHQTQPVWLSSPDERLLLLTYLAWSNCADSELWGRSSTCVPAGVVRCARAEGGMKKLWVVWSLLVLPSQGWHSKSPSLSLYWPGSHISQNVEPSPEPSLVCLYPGEQTHEPVSSAVLPVSHEPERRPVRYTLASGPTRAPAWMRAGRLHSSCVVCCACWTNG